MHLRKTHLGPAIALLTLGLAVLMATPVAALERFDFETPYLVHPENQAWDFSLIRDEGVYHAYYHTIPQHTQHPALADTIWHASSLDLRRWTIHGVALTVGPDWYDAVAMWAPDVVYDSDTQRWAMLYTGVSSGMVQRACLAWSDDLFSWTKSPANPVFEPDTLAYHWSPNQDWSSFRDPFVYHDGSQWNMLSTAGQRLGGYPGYRRGIVHRAVSADLVTWTDAGVFFAHDGAVGQNRDFESVQYLIRDGWHHLFFVEQDLSISNHPTSHMAAASPAGWTMADRRVVDAGWAPEIKDFDPGGAEVFARLAKDLDPTDGTWFVTIRFDSLRFDLGGFAPVVFSVDPYDDDWPVRSGSAAPTFGDNPVYRSDPGSGLEGHSWYSSAENYGGPLTEIGAPGLALGGVATSRIESRPFVLTGGFFRLLLGGGGSDAYLALLDDGTGEELSRVQPGGQLSMTERFWDVRTYLGRTVRLAVVDDDTSLDGWIAVDSITELSGPAAVDGPPVERVAILGAQPNPFNGGTEIRFKLPGPGLVQAEVFDLAGRRVWVSTPRMVPGYHGSIPWDGRGSTGVNLPSVPYFCRILVDGSPAGSLRITLLK